MRGSTLPGVILATVCAVLAGHTPLVGQTPINLSNQAWPPYFFGGDADRPAGLAQELLETCVPEAGFQPRFSPLPLERVYDALQAGILDAHILSRKVEREAYLHYGEVPLFSDGYRPVILAGSGITIESLDDMSSLRVGHLEGLRYSNEYLELIQERRRKNRLVSATSNAAILNLLLEGGIDVFVSLESTTRWMAKDLGIADKIEILDFDVRTGVYFLTVAKATHHISDPSLFLATVDACITRMKEDGRYQALTARYGLD